MYENLPYGRQAILKHQEITLNIGPSDVTPADNTVYEGLNVSDRNLNNNYEPLSFTHT